MLPNVVEIKLYAFLFEPFNVSWLVVKIKYCLNY